MCEQRREKRREKSELINKHNSKGAQWKGKKERRKNKSEQTAKKKVNTFDPSADDFGSQHYQTALQVNNSYYIAIHFHHFGSDKCCGIRSMV